MRCISILSTAIILFVTTTAWSQTTPFFPFVEQFDGRIDDDSPVSWEPGFLTEGTFEFSNGDLVLSGASVGVVVFKDGDGVTARDTSAQAQLLLSGTPTAFATIYSRSPITGEAYFGGIDAQGTIFAGEFFPDAPAEFSTAPTTLSPAVSDVILQFDTFENTMTVSAWDAGAPKPSSPPSLSFMDDTLTEGAFGLALGGGAGSVANVRSFQIDQIVPESSTVFFDDFSDGNHADGSPVTWAVTPFEPGALDASSGDAILGRDGTSIQGQDVLAEVRDVSIRNVSARSQLMVTETGGSSLIGVRHHADVAQGYFMGVSYLPEFGGSVVLLGRSDGPITQEFFSPVGAFVANLPYDVRQDDTVVQLDVFENEILGWYWHPDEEFPSEPQFVISDDTYDAAGSIRLVNGNRGSAQERETVKAFFVSFTLRTSRFMSFRQKARLRQEMPTKTSILTNSTSSKCKLLRNI